MTGDGTCGVFISEGVVVGKWRSQWEGEWPDGAGEGVESQQDVEGGGIYSASAGGITIVCSVAVCFSWVYVAVVSRICCPIHSSSTCPWRWKRLRVPKRRLLEPRRRGITQKKTYYNVFLLTKVNSQLLAPVSLVFKHTILKHIHTN